MTDDTYNGHRNRETWLVNLWLSNDEDTADEVGEAIADLIHLTPTAAVEVIAEQLHEVVRGWWHDDSLTWPGGLWSDLVGTALARVDWASIAAPWIERFWDERCEPNGTR